MVLGRKLNSMDVVDDLFLFRADYDFNPFFRVENIFDKGIHLFKADRIYFLKKFVEKFKAKI